MNAASHPPILSWIFKRSEQLDEVNRRLVRAEAKGCWEKPDDHTVWKGWTGEEQEATVGHGSLPPLPPHYHHNLCHCNQALTSCLARLQQLCLRFPFLRLDSLRSLPPADLQYGSGHQCRIQAKEPCLQKKVESYYQS